MTRVLIVEDDPFIRDITSVKCINHGYHVTVCATANEALTAFDTSSFEVAILDLDLPDMPGTELIKEVQGHQNGRHTKIIIFSNTSDPTRQAEVAQLGILGFFEKSSAEYDELFALIDSALLLK
jgi:DNA-binding response OmpR family regulator